LLQTQPNPADFSVRRYQDRNWSPADPFSATIKSVQIDAATNRLIIETDVPLDQYSYVTYSPNGDPNAVRDVAGNPLGPFQSWVELGSITATPRPNPNALPPARILDTNTWNLLNKYDPVNAQQTYAKFKVAGLLENSFPDFSNLSVEEAVQAVSLGRSENIEQTLRIQVTGLSAKNSEMRRDNTVLGDLGNMSPQVPSSTTSDKTVASVLKDKFKPLVDQINKDLKAAGLTNLFPTPGGMLDGSVTVGQLQGAIDKLKEVVDNLSTESNSDMLGLQSSTTKRNEAIQFVSDLLAKLAALISGMIQNIKD
jgi:hypothetical protein